MARKLIGSMVLVALATAALSLIVAAILWGRGGLSAVLLAVGGVAVSAALLGLLIRALTRGLVRPLGAMPPDLDALERDLPYPELEPLVTALQARQAQKQAGERMRQEFTANVTHELKTPLTSISGYAEMIETGLAKQGDVAAFAGKIRLEAARLLRLIGDILQLSRLDDPAAPRSLVTVDLRQLAQNAAQSQELAAARAGLTLTVAGGPAPLVGDRAMLEELVYNLCDNAVRYNRRGGSVTLVTGQSIRDVWLRVSDTGIGIPESQQERVFERFYRVDKSRSRPVGGTGLGLAIVKHAAMLHSGAITLESREGRGTTITVRFPADIQNSPQSL